VKHETIPAVVRDLMIGRQRIVKNWEKGHGHLAPAEGYCALSALACAGTRNWHAIYRFLLRALPAGQPSIHRYNDHPTTTKQDILDLYDRAIELALD